MPVELILIPPGQTRQRDITGDISAQIIKYAAVKPNERFNNISKHSQLFAKILADEDTQRFGLTTLTDTEAANSKSASVAAATLLPTRVLATILPAAKLQYGNTVIQPEHTGTWNLANRVSFAHPAPLSSSSNNNNTASNSSSSSSSRGRTASPTR